MDGVARFPLARTSPTVARVQLVDKGPNPPLDLIVDGDP
jgi:hypothetical protein